MVHEVLDNALPKLGGQLQRIFKGSLAQAELNAHREVELASHLNAAKRRAKPKTRRQVKGLRDD